MVILLDLDGVAVDFISGALRACESPLSVNDVTEYDVAKIMGLTEDDMWAKIDALGPDFWTNLPILPWFRPLYDTLSRLARVVFATVPSRSPHSVLGKKLWLDAQFGSRFRDYTITPQKTLLAKAEHVLIDDSQANVDSFWNAGGRAIVFPQPWNGRQVPTDTDRIVAMIQWLVLNCHSPEQGRMWMPDVAKATHTHMGPVEIVPATAVRCVGTSQLLGFDRNNCPRPMFAHDLSPTPCVALGGPWTA